MNERSCILLELPKILESLAGHTSFSAGRELALALRPTPDLALVKARVGATTEARRLLALRPSASLAGARDIGPLVKRAIIGGRIEPFELLDVLGTLRSGSILRAVVSKLDDDLPVLASVAARITDCPRLEAEIARCINEKAEVLSEASPALSRIRSSLRAARQRLLERLGQILGSEELRPMIQEPIITQREGRYVIPVKAEFKGKFRGIVHDLSASRATLFVEPMATVEMNNRIRELEAEEEHEIDRVLRDLSASVGAVGDELSANVGALAELDLALAKAHQAGEMHATEPELVAYPWPSDDAVLLLRNARHPLIGAKVVPISVQLGGPFRVLVVTGPNTGGKTVALKTVGLLVLMAQCGLHIPASEGSRVPICGEVFADIGDEQSIEQSLSTFSSHMRNVIAVLQEASADSLVLLDELGSGTDPSEGSALAQAILDFLLRRGGMVLATTHYSELKAYAHVTPQVENASVEFDLETLTPTYRLSIGLPGRSNALAIALRLGIPGEVAQAARERLHPSEVAVEQLLEGIKQERDSAESERQAAAREHEAARQLKRSLDERLADLERQSQAIIAQTREEARIEAGREIAAVRDQLREAMRTVDEKAHSHSNLLDTLRETHRIEREIEEQRESERVLRQRVDRHSEPVITGEGPVRVGDAVLVISLDRQAEVLSPPTDGQVDVQVGNFKMRVSLRDVRKLARQSSGSVQAEATIDLQARAPVPVEIEVRGWRAEDVPPVVDQYIQDAYLAGLPFVRIIHGKGTGVLRRLVREQLSKNPLVRSFHQPESRDGGEGVTVAELAS